MSANKMHQGHWCRTPRCAVSHQKKRRFRGPTGERALHPMPEEDELCPMQNLKILSQSDLHRRLEALQTRLGDHPQKDDIQRLLEDLQLHQIELELQNRELRDAHHALEQARDRYADLYDFAPVGYLTLDRKGKILEINLTGAHRLGIERSRILEMPFTAFLVAGESRRLFAHLQETFEQTGGYAAELKVRPRNGPPIDVRLQSRTMASADGDMVCRTAMIDVTDLKQAQQAAAEREAQYRAAIETTSDGFWAVDEQGRILAVNDAYIRRSGYSRDELLTMRIEDLEAVESAQEVRAHSARVRRNRNDLFETHHRTKTGEIWPAEVNAAYWASASGRIFAFVRDISERKELQAQIINVSAAEQERIGREIHDGIGQQLTALGMLATSLERRLYHEKRAAEAGAANELVQHLQQTLRDARALASGLSPIHIGPDELPDALSLLVERTQASSGISCRFDWDGPLGALDETVAVHLYRIVQEALHNATKHAHADRIDVVLRSADSGIVLSVHDDGIGIGSQNAGHGGLGLHIMEYRARLIGASLTVAAAPDGGTVVKCEWHRPT